MKESKIKTLNFIKSLLNVVLVVLMGVTIILSIALNKGQDGKLERPHVEHWNSNWSVAGGETIDFPYSVGSADRVIEFYNTLPDRLPEECCLAFASYYTIARVYIEELLIYSYGEQMPLPYGKMLGNIRLIVPLQQEDAGKIIRVQMENVYKIGYDHQGFLLDNLYKVQSTIYGNNIWRISVCVGFILLAVLSMLIAFYHNSVNEKKSYIMLCYAVFDLTVAAWLFFSSDLLQFLCDSNAAGSFVSYCALILMPCVFSQICTQMFPEQRRWFVFCIRIGIILWLCVMLLYVLNITDPPQIIVVTHMYMLLVIGSTGVVSFKNVKKDRIALDFFILIMIFCVFAISSIIAYYWKTGSGLDAQLVVFGFLIFSIGLLMIIEKNYISTSKKVFENQILKEQAYNDPMTGLGNRIAIETRLNEFSERLKENDYVTYIMCDLNYLKYTNDNFGHEAGDLLIQTAADCIKEVVGEHGSCYRLGGDEFAILLVNWENKWDRIVEELNDYMGDYNMNHSIALSMAIGVETRRFDSSDPDFFRDLCREADRKMYEKKKIQHEEYRKRGID